MANELEPLKSLKTFVLPFYIRMKLNQFSNRLHFLHLFRRIVNFLNKTCEHFVESEEMGAQRHEQ